MTEDITECADIWTHAEYIDTTFGPTLVWAHHPANPHFPTDWSCHDQKYEPVVEPYSGVGNSLDYYSDFDPIQEGTIESGTVRYALAMGLEVTEQARIRPEDLRHLAVRAGAQPLDAEPAGREPIAAIGSVEANPVLRFVVDALRFYFEFHARYDGFYGAFIHDPFVVAAALDPSLVRADPVFVDVEAGANLAHGMTVADWRRSTGNAPNVDVAVEGDAGTFLERFIDRVGGLAARRAAVAR